jgi:hypothetical protein
MHAQNDIYFSSQGCEQDQKNKFMMEESIGSRIGTIFLSEFLKFTTELWSARN